ncbi:MAG: ATP-dependent helicase [Clostridia bacterium]|jgi:superfamily I DNA/RNA helicase|nr:ATP-dependent helicase [Clostridia bacterium]
MVIAGPGTGKTHTLTSRIIYLVEKREVPPSRITAVTFTNKAAKEMRDRLEGHFGGKEVPGGMNIGTFHAIGLRLLARAGGLKSPVIIGEEEARTVMEEIIQEQGLKLSPRDVLRKISLLKNSATIEGEPVEAIVPREVFDAYCARLEQYGVMDFDDILLKVLERSSNQNSGNQNSEPDPDNPFAYLLVDEFQDINEVQYRLIKEWGKKSESILIIGDPDQSIYGFRGSDPRYFSRFKEDFRGLCPIRLTQNYRSTPEIIAGAAGVIAKQETGGPALESKRGKGSKIRLIETGDAFSEAVYIAKEINRLVGGMDMLDTQAQAAPGGKKSGALEPRGFADIALLYRTNHQAQVLEQSWPKKESPTSSPGGRISWRNSRSVRPWPFSVTY